MKENSNTYKHILFWLAYTSFWTIVTFENNVPLWQNVAVNLCFLIGHAGAVYFGIYVLLPKYFNKQKYLLLTFSALLSITFFALFISGNTTLILYLTEQDWQWIWIPRNWFPQFFLSTFWILAIFMAWKALTERRKAEKRNLALEKEKLQTELHFLKAQINPHFLFNALNSIYFQVANAPIEAQESILTFSEMLRYQLYDCTTEKVTLAQEIAYLENYLSIEELRKGERVKISFDRQQVNQSIEIAPLLFLPLVENACKWVSTEKKQHNFVNIVLRIRDNSLFFSVENTRSDATALTKSKGGIGQQNLARRLELLYPQAHRLTLQQNTETYLAVLELNLNNKNDFRKKLRNENQMLSSG